MPHARPATGQPTSSARATTAGCDGGRGRRQRRRVAGGDARPERQGGLDRPLEPRQHQRPVAGVGAGVDGSPRHQLHRRPPHPLGVGLHPGGPGPVDQVGGDHGRPRRPPGSPTSSSAGPAAATTHSGVRRAEELQGAEPLGHAGGQGGGGGAAEGRRAGPGSARARARAFSSASGRGAATADSAARRVRARAGASTASPSPVSGEAPGPFERGPDAVHDRPHAGVAGGRRGPGLVSRLVVGGHLPPLTPAASRPRRRPRGVDAPTAEEGGTQWPRSDRSTTPSPASATCRRCAAPPSAGPTWRAGGSCRSAPGRRASTATPTRTSWSRWSRVASAPGSARRNGSTGRAAWTSSPSHAMPRPPGAPPEPGGEGCQASEPHRVLGRGRTMQA